MSDFILGVLVVVFMVAITSFWFFTVYKAMSEKKTSLQQLFRQLLSSRDALEKAKGTPYFESASHALEVNTSVYQKAMKEYASLLQSPFYLLPARLMGFRSTIEVTT